MAFVVEMVVDRGVDGSELLERLLLTKSQHGTLSSSERQVAVLYPVVLPSAHFAAVEIAQFAHRSRIGTQSVGNDHLNRTVLLQGFLQKHQSRCFIALFRNETFEDLALVINRTPQIMTLAVDPDEHLVEVPAPVTKATHPIHPLAPDVGREQRAEPVPPQPYRLVANVDTQLEQQVLDVANDNGNRTYIITTNRITSGDELK